MNSAYEKQKALEALTNGDYMTAAEIYSTMITAAKVQNTSDVPDLLASRACCYLSAKQFELGLKDCNVAMSINPNTMKAYLHKGKILVELKKIDEARRVVEEARVLFGEHRLLIDLENIVNDSWFTVDHDTRSTIWKQLYSWLGYKMKMN